MENINFISESKLVEICADVLNTIKKAIKQSDNNLHKNIIDPFSAIFEASFYNLTLTEWIEREKARQIQKSLQNQIGTFHQKILGNINGWEDLKTGGIADLICQKKKIIAEVKNKFNTTKGNHKVAIYDDLKILIDERHKGYTGYYVAILSKNIINKPFTPSDNKTKQRRPLNKNIIEIDGSSFYELATGDNDSLRKIYNALPFIISNIIKNNTDKIIKDPLFNELFKKAFK